MSDDTKTPTNNNTRDYTPALFVGEEDIGARSTAAKDLGAAVVIGIFAVAAMMLA